ncbi:RcnB family protein [Novosphingobium beihaiensis]|uniref:RcnB family protein n=1 Tax=Novosphingobium beihaiensis TaxID=2930389 RepID=A0ABT0BMF7_9SPHN|nr:RcnB family protein [Novosphingobium beihaiensis]MCJ2186158.1 RcnB family protein [Novosphingobium beihaiensis]
MKRDAWLGASAWSTMAAAVAGLAMAVPAEAAPQQEREHRQWSGHQRSLRSDRNPQRSARPAAVRSQRQAAPERPRRSSQSAPKNWAEARARIANQREDRRGTTRTPTVRTNRSDQNERSHAWKSPDRRSSQDRDQYRNRDRDHETRSSRDRQRAERERNRERQRWERDRRNHDRWERNRDRERYERHRASRNNYRDWNRHAWRNDHRYNWRSYRARHRSTYRIGRYYAPYHGYSYRRFGIGIRLGSLFYSSRYWINDPWAYRLPAVYGPYRWVRYYDDVLLVNVYTGEVADVIYDFFW